MKKRRVNMSVLPGEPTDGSGRACIHLFVRDERGGFVEPHVLHPRLDADGQPIKQQLVAKPTRGRLACDRRRSVAPVTRNGVIYITHRTESADAVTCPKCIATLDYKLAIRPMPVEATEAGK